MATGSTGRQDGGQVVDFQIRMWSETGQQVFMVVYATFSLGFIFVVAPFKVLYLQL